MKLIANISVTVVRDGKRIDTGPGTKYANKTFDYTDQEVKSVTKAAPNAFRKGVNELSAAAEDDTTAPDGNAEATANTAPKKSAAKKAAEKSSTSDAATKTEKTSGEPADSDGGEDDDI